MSTRVPAMPCLTCGHVLDAATGVDTQLSPKVGDISICINCATISIFDENLKMRLPTDEETASLRENGLIVSAQIMIRKMRKDGK